MRRILLLIIALFSTFTQINAQITIDENIDIDYRIPKEYEIGGITISGVKFLDENVLLMLSGLAVGDKISVPGDEITSAIRKLWKQGLFENIKISATKVQDDLIFLDINLVERPRLSKFRFVGINRSDADNLREKINLSRGDVVTENLLKRTEYKIKKYFVGKGFLNVDIAIKQEADTAALNKVILNINIRKNNRVKIREIEFIGNDNVHKGTLKRSMKETKEKSKLRPFHEIDKFLFTTLRDVTFHNNDFDIEATLRDYTQDRLKFSIFKSSKYIASLYKDDKVGIIDKYNELGYRDAAIIEDSVIRNNDKTIDLRIKLKEGPKYFFRDITWAGNTKFDSDQLSKILRIEKGEVYNQKKLETNLYGSMEGLDISTLYMDDGYLFFNATPVETNVDNDSIDIQIRIYEGKQATIEKVILKGNTRTNDHVVYREIRTRPGELFSRSKIMRTQRELAQLRYFNAETMGVNPIPDPQKGTVDIEYQVEETSTDQIELSGGWGYNRFIGTLGLSFNNFSAKNIFNWDSYKPLPSGDGQRLSLRAQATGKLYQNYSVSFTEPWLGGKKPNSLTVSLYRSVIRSFYQTEETKDSKMVINGASAGIGRRLQWPDDYFTLYTGIRYQSYKFKDYNFMGYTDGFSNNINLNIVLGRSSIDAPIFPTSGSDLSLNLEATPPYSWFDGRDDYAGLNNSEKYKWIEYHKWKFKYSWYTGLAGKLVLNSKAQFGILGNYNTKLGDTPFERFYLGGDGMTGYANFDSREIIALRGYEDRSLTNANGATVYNKYTLELRYPLSLNPNATIYGLTFVEGGNSWEKFRDFNAYDIKRSAGLGLRLFLPMLGGLLGFDWGYGFDPPVGSTEASRGQFHFSINQSID